jgi:hypothetical protein
VGSGNGIFNVLALIVVLSMVAVAVGSANTKGVIQSMGDAFSGSIDAAIGKSSQSPVA